MGGQRLRKGLWQTKSGLFTSVSSIDLTATAICTVLKGVWAPGYFIPSADSKGVKQDMVDLRANEGTCCVKLEKKTSQEKWLKLHFDNRDVVRGDFTLPEVLSYFSASPCQRQGLHFREEISRRIHKRPVVIYCAGNHSFMSLLCKEPSYCKIHTQASCPCKTHPSSSPHVKTTSMR